ncbi:MAG: sigma-70 family RNA polymerase sigma factor [Burkholderiales bacterium]|nr:sigma-70 family RNA polymerase sigma factor [Burkholderiales bacterium]
MIFNANRKQFEQTVRAYSADLYRFAYALCRDRFLAEDLVQLAFERAWKNWGDLREPVAVKSWLLTIVRREHARSYERKQLDTTDDDPEELLLASHHQPGAQLEMEQLVESMPLAYREALLLQVLGGYSCAEIAAILDTTEGAVMTRLSRARQALRSHWPATELRRVK